MDVKINNHRELLQALIDGHTLISRLDHPSPGIRMRSDGLIYTKESINTKLEYLDLSFESYSIKESVTDFYKIIFLAEARGCSRWMEAAGLYKDVEDFKKTHPNIKHCQIIEGSKISLRNP